MAVKIQGEHRFDAPREVVWQALLDPEVLSRTLPGCEKLEEVGEHRLAGVINMKVGPVQGQFTGNVELTDVRPLEGYHLRLDGQGAPGFVKGEGDIALADAGGGTTLTYDVDAQVGGRIAGVGQRLLDSSARVITRQALEGLAVQVAARQAAATAAAGPAAVAGAPSANEAPAPAVAATAAEPSRAAGPEEADRGASRPPTPAPAAPLPEAPTQAEFAGRFAKGMADELIPPARRRWLVAAALVVAALVLVLLLRAC